MLSPVFGVISVPDFGHSNRCTGHNWSDLAAAAAAAAVIVSHSNFYLPDDIRHGESFHMFICHLHIFTEKVFVKDFGPFFNLVISLLLSFKCSFSILANSPLSDMTCKYFLPLYGSLSNPLDVILLFFTGQKF